MEENRADYGKSNIPFSQIFKNGLDPTRQTHRVKFCLWQKKLQFFHTILSDLEQASFKKALSYTQPKFNTLFSPL